MTQNRPDLNKVGHKDDIGKPMVFKGFFCQFPNAIEAVASMVEMGANRYAWDNWKKFEDETRINEALGRHTLEEAKGNDYNDSDFGYLEAVHIAWCAMARLEIILRTKPARRCIMSPKE